MKKACIAIALLFSVAVVSAQDRTSAAKTSTARLEAKVNQLWGAFKNKDKTALAALLDEHFRLFEEGLSTFGDKKSEVNAVDDFELISYTLSDFRVKPVGTNAALVTYIARYEGKSGGEHSKAKSVFGEVWTRSGNEWKALYMQETYVK
jgi:hypothetical protein